jgi:Mg-chelatase subunit ChlD
MGESTRASRRKIEAAIEAARTFLDLMTLTIDDASDQAAIVAFNHDAWLLASLTTDRRVLNRALDAITLGQQTRLDLAISVGAGALADDTRRRAGNSAVLILLTDGRANQVPMDVVLEAAARAKARGITVFTIGLGDEVDVGMLVQIASWPEAFLHAPDAEDLADAYRTVARRVPCPANAYWGGR